MSDLTYWDNGVTRLYHTDARSIPLPDESAHCVVTSPPYWNLRDFGLSPSVWGGASECPHYWLDGVVAPGARSSDSKSGSKQLNANRRDGMPTSAFCGECGAWLGALGLEPTVNLYVSHNVEIFREVWRVLRKDGTCWINLGDSYSGRRDGNLKPKDLVGMPWRVALALQDDGWWLRSPVIWDKPNPMRESVTDRLTTSHEYVFMLTKSGNRLYWTHPTRPGVRSKPPPDYRYLYDDTGEVVEEPPKPQSTEEKSVAGSWKDGKVLPASGIMVSGRRNRPQTRSTQLMLPPERPDRIQIAFDDHRLVANAGLLLPVTLAQRLGLSQLVDRHVDLGRTPGRANTGDKMMTLVASALAGGDCIDDADVLRTGGTAGAIGCVVKAPSTLGTFLRSFRWGHVRQLDRVSRELLAIAAGTGDVLMARLRKGRANTARGAAHLLRETVGRVRYAGATGPLTVRADSGFYTHAVVAVCRKAKVRFSITVRQHQSLRQLIEAIPEEDWTPIPIGWTGPPTWLRPPIRLSTPSPTPRRCASSSAGCSPRPAPNWRCSPTIAITPSSPTGRAIPWISRPTTAATPRSRTPSATSSTAWASTTCHRAVFPPILSLPKGAWLAVQSLPRTRYGVIAHNLARWTARIGLGEQLVTTKTLRRRFFSLAGRLTRSARRLTLHLPQGWPWENQFGSAVARLRTLPLPS